MLYSIDLNNSKKLFIIYNVYSNYIYGFYFAKECYTSVDVAHIFSCEFFSLYSHTNAHIILGL
jgi:hypothetical protein